MALRDFVAHFPADWRPRQPAFPADCAMARTQRALDTAADATTMALPPLALDDLVTKLVRWHDTGDSLKLSPREWRHSVDCLTVGEVRLIDDPDFVKDFLDELSRHATTATINRLVRWYLRHHTPDHVGVHQVGTFLAAHLDRVRPVWQALHRAFGLFHAERAARQFAATVVESGRPPLDILAEFHCPAAILSTALFGHSFLEACRILAEGPPPPLDQLRTMQRWGFKDEEYQYHNLPAAQSQLAEALLRPWSARVPGEFIRTFAVGLLLPLMGDPRTNPTGWAEVSQPARRVMLAWVTKDALDQFLEVVDDTVQTHQSRMWAERRQFWSTYYENAQIHECWVVFGRRGAALARHLAAKSNNPALANFGSLLRDSGSDASQAVLLMKIDNLLVADWSHNGRCYIWLPGNRNAPMLYQNDYVGDQLLSGADFETPHHKQWREEVREYITTRLVGQQMSGELCGAADDHCA